MKISVRHAAYAVALAAAIVACGSSAAPAATPAPPPPKQVVYDLPGDAADVIAFCDGGTRVYARGWSTDGHVVVVPSSPECAR